MTKARKRKRKTKKKPGPKTDRLKINMNWVDAVKQSLLKKKPKRGWPELATE
ncbi:MAG TPA: hypothetical protein VMV72_00205 [Verrucomicrobiae bacterium]|jgi:hypothetical protein|nr:hypothetical protein [Verrucomicrobiae bacterium]